jgi:hypothetical protein
MLQPGKVKEGGHSPEWCGTGEGGGGCLHGDAATPVVLIGGGGVLR